MSTYRKLHGRSIQAVTTDPTESVAEGQIWYNTTSDTFKTVLTSAAWSSGTSLTTPRHEVSGFGTQTASVAVGGYDRVFPGGSEPVGSLLTSVEEYNGSGWASGTALPVASTQYCRAGTQTAGLISFAMRAPVPTSPSSAVSFEYDGSSWTTGGTGNKARRLASGNGTQTAAIAAGGFNNPDSPQSLNNSESYDGSSWTATNTLNVSGFNGTGAGAGTSTANIIITRNPAPTLGQVSEWDGTNWTSGTSLNTSRGDVGLDGIQTSALAFGGITPSKSNATEEWNGTSWTAKGNMGTARSAFAGSGGTNASTTALAAGGTTGPGVTSVTEEYNKSANTITAAAWSSGGSLNVPRVQTYGAGSQTAGLIFGGEGPPGARNQTEEYDGSTWTAVNNMPATNKDHAGFGIQTAAVACGGSPNTTSINYDGTNWTASPGSLNTGRTNAGGTGTQTAGLTFGGYPSVTATEEYGGSTWTTGGALPTGRQNYFAAGTQTAALGAGGGPPTSTDTFEYDGSSWTSGGTLISGTIDARGGGTQTDALYAGGYLHPGSGYPTTTLGYDGTNWSTRPSLATATAGGGSGQNAAPASANWIAGGNPSPAVAVTQEFTGETTSLNVKTLTQS